MSEWQKNDWKKKWVKDKVWVKGKNEWKKNNEWKKKNEWKTRVCASPHHSRSRHVLMYLRESTPDSTSCRRHCRVCVFHSMICPLTLEENTLDEEKQHCVQCKASSYFSLRQYYTLNIIFLCPSSLVHSTHGWLSLYMGVRVTVHGSMSHGTWE